MKRELLPALLLLGFASLASQVNATCGDGIVDRDEECDDGGSCVGGPTAGAWCTADAQCGPGPGRCRGGLRPLSACNADADCAGGTCVRCETFGGDGCAANCTTESRITLTIEPGQIDAHSPPLLKAGASGVMLYGDILTIPLPLTGSQTFTVGKEVNGQIPFVVKAADIRGHDWYS